MNFRKNRQWGVIAAALVIVGILALALGGFLSPVGNAVSTPFIQVQQWLTVRYQTFQDFFNAPTDLVRLRQRNTELEAEVVKLQTKGISLH